MGDTSDKAAVAASQNLALSNDMYNLSSDALKGGTSYLTGLYGMGGPDQSAKYGAMAGLTADQNAGMHGSFLDPASMGNTGAMKAEAIAGVGSQKVLSGLDEMNKLRSQLAGQGLATTNFAQQAGAQSAQALRGMESDSTMSWVNAGLGTAAAAYGGFNQPQTNPFAGNQINPGLQPGGVWGGGFTQGIGGVASQPGSTGMVSWGTR